MTAVTQIQSRTVVLPTTDIDTDQIIPARFRRTQPGFRTEPA
jgi:3-isopropylmalate dehydratase small subunit